MKSLRLRLSSPAVILIELARRGGKARWSDLVEAMKAHGYAVATLDTSLYKLIAEGCIAKESGTYILTEKGWNLARELREQLLKLINEIPVKA